MLKVEDLTFSYRRGWPNVLDGISFTAEPGRLIALLGENGAGKSTLFHCLLGFEKNYGGAITLDGKDLRRMSRKEIASLVAYVPQSEMPVFNYSVFNTVLMGTTGTMSAFAAPGEEQISCARQAVEYLGIDHLAERGVKEISGGERQLTMLARAIAQSSRIMVMDEPTANLDYGNQQLVLRHIKNMTREGYTIIFSTHNPEHALQYASHVLVIKDHKIAADGPTEDALTESLIQRIYGLSARIIQVPLGDKTVKSCIPVDDTIH